MIALQSHTFSGVLRPEDTKRNIPHEFEIPFSDGAAIEISFEYAPYEVGDLRNLLCLTLIGPSGFRGAGHRGGARQVVRVSANGATPGYLPGVLERGTWVLYLDTHAVLPGEPCSYQITVTTLPLELGPHDASGGEEYVHRTVPAPERWYLGDLHCHTHHSDGRWDVATLFAAAERRGLDFVALTDHNTTSGILELERARPATVLAIPGMELTTFWGHALSLGSRDWVDWRLLGEGDSMARLAAERQESGALFVVAHPCAEGDPVCTGCDWRYADVMPGPASLVEIWNGPWEGDRNNELALSLWYGWLNAGHRIVGTAGTDSHGPTQYQSGVGFSSVWAEQLSQRAILAGIRAGHLYLTAGPRLLLTGREPAGGELLMGDSTDAADVTVHACWRAPEPGATVRLIVDGACRDEEWTVGEGERTWEVSEGRPAWCLLELRDASNRMLAVTNPIYLGGVGLR